MPKTRKIWYSSYTLWYYQNLCLSSSEQHDHFLYRECVRKHRFRRFMGRETYRYAGVNSREQLIKKLGPHSTTNLQTIVMMSHKFRRGEIRWANSKVRLNSRTSMSSELPARLMGKHDLEDEFLSFGNWIGSARRSEQGTVSQITASKCLPLHPVLRLSRSNLLSSYHWSMLGSPLKRPRNSGHLRNNWDLNSSLWEPHDGNFGIQTWVAYTCGHPPKGIDETMHRIVNVFPTTPDFYLACFTSSITRKCIIRHWAQIVHRISGCRQHTRIYLSRISQELNPATFLLAYSTHLWRNL